MVQKSVGHYANRGNVAYWDGRNGFREKVASSLFARLTDLLSSSLTSRSIIIHSID